MLLAAALLAGCADMMWNDMTGRHRSGARAEADHKACASESGILDPNATFDQSEAYRQRIQVCMFARGWRAADFQHL